MVVNGIHHCKKFIIDDNEGLKIVHINNKEKKKEYPSN